MSSGLEALFWGIVTFSLLIVIHEGGHFLTARMFGVKVHEFMIGLPGPALRLRGKKTTYGITAIPLGGYVRIAGMEPGPEDPLLGPALVAVTRRETTDAAALAAELGIEEAAADRLLITLSDWDALEALPDDEYSYRSKFSATEATDERALLDRARTATYRALTTWKRVVVLSAGVVFNLITAVLVFSIVLSYFGVLTTKISAVSEGSAAKAAGVRVGDRIVGVEGHRTSSWEGLSGRIARYDAGETITVVVERDGADLAIKATLGKNPDTGTGLLGVSPTVEKPTPIRAVLASIGYIGLTFGAILQFFNPETARQALSQSASVIGASYIAADAARTSALNYAAIVALLSLSLGVINIFPIPPLDGGKVAIELFERLRGRPLSRRVSLGLSAAGAALLFGLIFYLMYSDVVRYILK